jgi:CRISPR-associated protein Csh2
MENFEKRVFGCAVIKAINSNYNADFSGQPRTLPDGTVYATDKAFKYTVKNYIKDVYDKEYVLYFKRLKKEKEDFNPFDLVGAYEEKFKPSKVKDDKSEVIAKNLLSCIDVRLFGATFAPKGDGIKGKNISIHGPVQINHGVNVWHENNIYSEQIMSPFRNPGEAGSEEKNATTLGRQSKLQEGHYVHHFSVNPQNLKDVLSIAGISNGLTSDDITKLKEAMRHGATWYDSASKAGSENELLVWVQLKPESKLVLPNFTSLITVEKNKQEGKPVFDFSKLTTELTKHKAEIELIEIFVNTQTTVLKNTPEGAQIKEL